MKYLSGFSGIEAASVAWNPLGWEAAGVMEVDPFACAVLGHHYPGVPNLGDVSGVDAEMIRSIAPFDLFVFGWPCQDLSVAGKRAGLKGERSGLFYEATRILRLGAEHAGCSWFVAENVPGLLSSRGGRDFAEVIREITGLTVPVPRDGWGNGGVVARNDGGWSIAWRVLDAQFFGVPQRRRRVFVVGHSGGLWQRAAAVLFERESLSGHPPAGREAGEVVAGCLGGGSGERGWCDDHDRTGAFIPDVAFGLQSTHGRNENGSRIGNAWNTNYVAHSLRADGFDASEDGTGRGTPPVPVAYQCHGNNVGPMGTIRTGNGNTAGGVPFIVNAAESCATQSHARKASVARCLDSTGSFANAQGGTVVATGPKAFNWQTGGDGRLGYGDRPTALQAEQIPALHAASGVRRLTPRECERLQGFPTVIERTIIDVCFNHQNNCVLAEVRCLRSLGNALPVDDGESTALALSADATLWNDRESREALVAAHVRSSHEHRLAALRSQGKWLWSANGAAADGWSLPSTPRAAFARGIAVLARRMAAETPIGREGSPQRPRRFTLPAHGRWLAGMFGRGSGDAASAAESALAEGMRFITSNREPLILPSDWPVTTWLSFALDVMTSCIPAETRRASSCKAVFDVETDFTLVPYRGKPAADGPRYRALGNSFAVPVVAWIGKRIQMVEAVG